MKWMKNRELPPWAHLLGGLLVASGGWINVLTEQFLLGTLLICIGSWLIRWWFEVPADHPRFQKFSERRFRFWRKMVLTCSWGMLILTAAAVCLSIYDVIP